jgi:hypothetical protein
MLWQKLLLMKNRPSMYCRKFGNCAKLYTIGGSAQLCVNGRIWVVITPKRIQNVKTTGVLGLAVVYLTDVHAVVIWMLGI